MPNLPEIFDLEKALAAITKKNEADKDEWACFQEEQRQKLNLTQKNLSAADQKFQQGITTVNFALHQLDGLQGTDNIEAINLEMDRMAEGYALQGDYRSAVDCSRNEDKKAEYAKVAAAIKIDDDKTCPCNKKAKGTNAKGKPVDFPTNFIKDVFYSQHHGCLVNLWQCTTCGFLNARP